MWLRAARLPTLTAAITPVLVGSAVPAASGRFDAVVFAAALGGALLIQVGANYANDLFDFQKGADAADRLGPTRVTATGAVTQRQIAIATAVVFTLAALCGGLLLVKGGVIVLVVGLASIVAALTYVGGPWPYGYHGLGDLACFVFFGVVPVATLDLLHGGALTPASIGAALPVGCLISAILVVNNLRDLEQDRRSGKRTLAVILGDGPTRLEWALLVGLAYAMPAAGVLAGLWGAGALVAWLSAPLAIRLAMLLRRERGRSLNAVLRDTARLNLLFNALFALGLILR
ncbi:MAG: 1,4-dihydroxy-2-naphthoate polyprenyltransferase [Chloroflexi bacterium]|nr:1,4-dihydroxy-2-naphthoate polyprenyltransferase [Chloroflexota bacterium]